MRIGLIGTGSIAERHMQALRGEPLQLIHLATSVEKSAAFAQASGSSGFVDIDGFLRKGRPDAVIVAVPPHRHGEIEKRLVTDGIPFLVEKPLSADLQTGERIAARLVGRGLVAAVGYNWRALDTLGMVRAALAGRPPRLVCGRYHVGLPKAWWWRQQALSGGQFVEQACHLVDLARVLVGEAQVQAAAGHAFPRMEEPPADILPVSAALLRYASGALGLFSAVNVLARPGPVELEIVAEGVHVRLGLSELVISTADGETTHRPAGNTYRIQDLAFLEAVSRGDPAGVLCSYDDALVTHRLCHAIAAAAGADCG